MLHLPLLSPTTPKHTRVSSGPMMNGPLLLLARPSSHSNTPHAVCMLGLHSST
jgi:hypothetical protein